MEKAVALAVDSNYLDKALVTIKSICVYNRNITFYLFNQDTPVEWVRNINRKLEPLGSKLINVKIYNYDIAHLTTFLTVSTWFRLFLADYIPSSRVLYLDSDIIVNTNLDYLFELDFKGYYLAAVKDPHKNEEGGFNAGMLLANLELWREDGLTKTLLKTAEELHRVVKTGDQSILNIVCHNRWLSLNKTWNFQTYDVVSRYNHRSYLYLNIENRTPNIIHFLTSDKPWNENSVARFRELWWYYFQLDFCQLTGKQRKVISYEKSMELLSVSDIHLFTLTSSDNLEHIESLICRCSTVQFHIGAYTTVSNKLSKLEQYPNVLVYPELIEARIEKLITLATAYLDINHGPEVGNILQRVHLKQKPIYSFNNTSHQENITKHIVNHNSIDNMVVLINELNLNQL
ncbi:TPA: glycosyltransferase family 8 protein [Streptococcus agalactiae]